MELPLDGSDLRHLRIIDIELAERVCVAVRDAPWNTIPATFDGWEIDHQPDPFTVRFRGQHRHETIAFEWDGTIEGHARWRRVIHDG